MGCKEKEKMTKLFNAKEMPRKWRKKNSTPKYDLNVKEGKEKENLVALKHALVSAAAFCLSAKEAEIYALEVSEVDTPLSSSIPEEYHDLKAAFSEVASNELPAHGACDMKIEFKEGQEPRNTGLRPLPLVELEELQRYLDENLGKGWIRRSKSPVSAPTVFARKKDGSIWVCIDYRNFNKVIVWNRYPLPFIPELTD
jgi:hypothetical protein